MGDDAPRRCRCVLPCLSPEVHRGVDEGLMLNHSGRTNWIKLNQSRQERPRSRYSSLSSGRR